MKAAWMILTVLLLTGCHSLVAPQQARFGNWLQEANVQLQLNPEQARQALKALPAPQTDFENFHALLLNQQRQDRDGWIHARDALRTLLKTYQGQEVEGLLRALLVHNQAMINAQQRHGQSALELEKRARQLEQSRLEARRLEAKIEALTNLERRLNTRKGSVDDATLRGSP